MLIDFQFNGAYSNIVSNQSNINQPSDKAASFSNPGPATRLAALLALALSTGSAVVSGWLLYASYTNVWALRERHAIPALDSRFDSIAAAAAVGRLDVLSMLLSWAAIIAGIALIYSYTAFRSAAIEAAVEELKLRLPTALENHMGERGEALIAAALKDAELLAHIQRGFTSVGIDDTETADDVDNEPNWTEG